MSTQPDESIFELLLKLTGIDIRLERGKTPKRVYFYKTALEVFEKIIPNLRITFTCEYGNAMCGEGYRSHTMEYIELITHNAKICITSHYDDENRPTLSFYHGNVKYKSSKSIKDCFYSDFNLDESTQYVDYETVVAKINTYIESEK